jgi:hypothetical protein
LADPSNVQSDSRADVEVSGLTAEARDGAYGILTRFSISSPDHRGSIAWRTVGWQWNANAWIEID